MLTDRFSLIEETSDEIGGRRKTGRSPTRVRDVEDELATSRSSSVDSATPSRDATENAINRARKRQYEQLTPILLRLISESDLEYGFSSALDVFLKQRLSENAVVTKEWLNDLFVHYFNDASVVTGVLRALAHVEYDEISPQGPTMALAALNHRNVEVQECGVRAFENWAAPECLKILKSLKCSENWLRSYVEQVVTDLESEWGSNVTARKED